MKKYFYYISLIVIMLVIALVIFFKIYISSEVRDSCNQMKFIANDDEKIRHIKSKVASYYGSEELLDSIGKTKYVDKNFNSTVFDKLDIDWNYIGLPEYFVQIYFDGVMYNEGEFKRIRVVFGRNAISIDLNETNLAESDLKTPGDQFRRIKINEAVTVLCPR